MSNKSVKNVTHCLGSKRRARGVVSFTISCVLFRAKLRKNIYIIIQQMILWVLFLNSTGLPSGLWEKF